MNVEEMLAAARSEYAGRLVARVSDLDALARKGAWSELRVAAHKLRGSAATYGFSSLSSLAAAIEDALLASGCSPDAAAVAGIGQVLIAACAEADRAARGTS
jgi:HPt (histidine-containing phosphotransfer) domain-containing protein